MTSVGETLRSERLRRNLELDQISRELRISTKFLEAIEEERFDLLPGSHFAKSFVRQYARMLDLNESELAAEVQRVSEPVQAVFEEPETKPHLEAIQLPRVDGWPAARSRLHWTSSLPALGGVVAVMLACSAIYTWWQGPRTTTAVPPVSRPAETVVTPPQTLPDPVTEPAPAPVEAAPAQEIPGPPPSDAPPALGTPGPLAAKPITPMSPIPAGQLARTSGEVAAAATATTAKKNAAVAVRVILTAGEPAWVLARSNGRYLFSGTLEPNQTRTVETAGELLLRFGDAGAVNVNFNGKNLGALGPKGQVRTVQFTSGGFQIVPAPNSSASARPR